MPSIRRATGTASGAGANRADQVPLDQHIAAHGEFLSDGESIPDRVLAQKELAAQLQLALDHLPFDQRTAIILREIDGLSYEEIAFSLGVAPLAPSSRGSPAPARRCAWNCATRGTA